MKLKFKFTNSKTLNTILFLNFVILLAFSVFISLNSLIFSNVNDSIKNQKVNRDKLFLSYVYQNLYANVTDCFSQYKYGAGLESLFEEPESAEALQKAADFLLRIKNLNREQNECYIISAASNTIVSGSGLLTKDAFFKTYKLKNETEFQEALFTDGNIQVFQAVHSFNNKLTGITFFITSYRDTTMILSYTTQALNTLLINAISEQGNQATVFLNNDIVCSSFKTTIDQHAVITVEQLNMSDYLPIVSPMHGTDFDVVYYKFTGGFDRMNRFIAVISIVFLCILLAIDLTVYYIIRKSFYNPLKRILNQHAGGETAGVVNEYAALETLVSDLQEKYTRSLNVEESLKYENAFMRAFTGDMHTRPSEVMTAYEKFIIIKIIIDNGNDNAAHYRKLELSLSRQFAYKRITVSDTLSYFILNAGGKGAPDLTALAESGCFYLAGVSRKSSGAVQNALEQCEKAFACTGEENRVVCYKENLKTANTINVSQETLNELMSRVAKGKLSAVTETLDDIFDSNRKASIGQIKAVCNCLSDLLHIVSINTNTLIESFQSFYAVRDIYHYDKLKKTVFEIYREVTQLNFEKSDNRISEIVKCVNEEYNTQISLQSLSDRFELPVEQISRLFKKQTGVNFVHYKQQKRIEKAKEMLLDGKSVNEICQYVGFSNLSNFIRLFEKNVGVTPGKYKQSVEKSVNERR